MKVAIVADLHGNYHGLEAILHDIEEEQPDMIVGAGDLIGCSPYSAGAQVLQTLHQRGVPMVRGNHEEYILSYHHPAPNPLVKKSIRFMPVRYVAQQFAQPELDVIQQLPVTYTVRGPHGDDLLVCHASPDHLSRSFASGIDEHMAHVLHTIPAPTIVGAHTHIPWHTYWRGKLLLVAGSGGLPFSGRPEVEYLLLEYVHGQWTFRHKRLPYNVQAAVQSVLDSNFLQESGPIGWLLFNEILTHQDTLMPFFRSCCADSEPSTFSEWQETVKTYLQQTERWEVVGEYLTHYGLWSSS